MKIRHPWAIGSLAFLGAGFLRLWGSTLSFRLDARAVGPQPSDPADGRYLYAFWHEALLGPACYRTPVHVMVSQHADGELITQLVRWLGLGVVRGSTTRGGIAGTLALLEQAKHTHLALTPDGPRGPRRQVQQGLAYIASATGLPLVPVGVGFSSCWRAGSWDRFALPKPFSRVRIVQHAPFIVPPGLDRAALEPYRLRAQAAMDEATEVAHAWACSGESQPPHAVMTHSPAVRRSA